MNMLTEKFNKFIELVGGEKKVKDALETAELTEKEAEKLGISWKGGESESDPAPDPEGDVTEPEGDEPEGEEPESEDDNLLGEMTPKQFQELQGENLKEVMEPLGVQLKEIQSAQSLSNDTQTSMKEVMEGQAKQLKAIDERVKDLEGETPRGQKGYHPSQDDETVIDDEHSLKGVKPGIDPEWQEGFFPGSTGK